MAKPAARGYEERAWRGEGRVNEPNGLLVGTAWEFRHRTWMILAVCALAAWVAFLIPDPLTGGRPWLTLAPMRAAAFLVAAAGVAIRVWATGYLPFAIIADPKLHAPRLVDSGPYALTRNPLYLGTWLGISSLGLVLNLWGALLLPALLALRVLRIIGYEEKSLRAAFGADYEAYAARVPRLWPRSLADVRRAFGEKSDWLYGLRGNLFILGLPIGYLATFWRPSFDAILWCVGAGLLAQWPVLRAERRARPL